MGVHQGGEVYAHIKKILGIPRDEPIFILRAQDDATPGTLSDYLANAKDVGADEEFKGEVVDVIMAFADWRSHHENSCKTPD